MFVKFRTAECLRLGQTPPPDLREHYLRSNTQDETTYTVSAKRVNQLERPSQPVRRPSLVPPDKKDKDEGKRTPPLPRAKTPEKEPGRDLMISYSHADKEIMSQLRDSLEEHGISVWVDVIGLGAGVNFLTKIGQAIIDAKLFISIVSRSSIKSKYCQDELALAYVSQKPIFPVALEDKKQLMRLMDAGSRLQLAGFKWTPFLEPQTFSDNFQDLLTLLKAELEKQNEKKTAQVSGNGHQAGSPGSARPKTPRHKFYTRISSSGEMMTSDEINKLVVQPDEFWSQHFQDSTEVEWKRFCEVVCDVYSDELEELYGSDRLHWLMTILSREMEVEDDVLLRSNFMAFCDVEDELSPFWFRMEDQAKESLAMEGVFNMESSVRVEAIENLAKFKSPAVIDALQDLLTDERADVRAIAAISLARIGADDVVTVKKLMSTLKDRDRLVREAGCIAFGKLKIQTVIRNLVHIWRNDVIADVRASAELALKQIGGPEVEKEMKVTQVLGEEIRMLTKRNA